VSRRNELELACRPPLLALLEKNVAGEPRRFVISTSRFAVAAGTTIRSSRVLADCHVTERSASEWIVFRMTATRSRASRCGSPSFIISAKGLLTLLSFFIQSERPQPTLYSFASIPCVRCATSAMASNAPPSMNNTTLK
jgi:hypothetical protein